MAHSADSLTLKLPSSLFPLGPGLPQARWRHWASLLFSDIGSACPLPRHGFMPTYLLPTIICPFGFCLGSWEVGSSAPDQGRSGRVSLRDLREPLPPRLCSVLPARSYNESCSPDPMEQRGPKICCTLDDIPLIR